MTHQVLINHIYELQEEVGVDGGCIKFWPSRPETEVHVQTPKALLLMFGKVGDFS